MSFAAAKAQKSEPQEGDGSVRIYQGENLVPVGRIDLGSDADNVRIDAAAQRVYVGHADGAIAVIDPASRSIVNDIHVKDHPEGFQLDPVGPSIWVNIPDHREIGVLDRTSGRQIASWPMEQWGENFPMALQPDQGRLAVVFRHPARLAVFDTKTGKVLDSAETCRDSDDVFVDTKRRRLYVSCGEGYIDVFSETAQGLSRSVRFPTIRGARTALYSPELDRLFLAVRASGNFPACIWVLRATP
ncbi:MAG: YncE family protein [Steroidobacteraceae bacterium]